MAAGSGTTKKQRKNDTLLCILTHAALYYRPGEGRFVLVPEGGREILISIPDADRMSACIASVVARGVVMGEKS